MFGDLRMTVLPCGGFSELVKWVDGSLEILRIFSFYFGTVGFYLGRGATWVVCFDGCGLPGLVCFNKVTLRFSHLT